MVNQELIAKTAEKHDSFYLYDEAVIEERIHRLQQDFPGVYFLYSIKCNAHQELLKSVFSRSFGADAASAGEVDLAKKCGLSCNEIFYSAPGKSDDDLRTVMDDSIIIADSLGEIERIQKLAFESGRLCRIGVRLNPSFSMQDDIGSSSKFGIDEESFFAWAKSCPALPNIEIIGLHVHLQSQILEEDILGYYYDRMFALAERFYRLPGIRLEFLNLGSGMGIPYSLSDCELDTGRLGEIVNRRIESFCKVYSAVQVIIEVGRYVAGPAGIFVTKVMDKKVSRGKIYLILKNALNGFIRPSLACLVGKYSDQDEPAGCEPLFTGLDAFQYEILKKSDSEDAESDVGPGASDTAPGAVDFVGMTSKKNDLFSDQVPLEKVTLVGNLCTSADVIAEDILLPTMVRGDLMIVKNAGSYAAALSPMQFSSQEQPAEFFIRKKSR